MKITFIGTQLGRIDSKPADHKIRNLDINSSLLKFDIDNDVDVILTAQRLLDKKVAEGNRFA